VLFISGQQYMFALSLLAGHDMSKYVKPSGI